MLRTHLTHLQGRFLEDDADGASRIVRGASELFVTNGYEGTSTDMIAAAAGVKPSALYRLFESKDAILVAALENIFEGFLADTRQAVAGVTDPCARLARIAWAHTWLQLSFDVFSREGIGMLFSTGQLLTWVSPERGTRLRDLAREHVERTRAILEDGIESELFCVPDARTATQALLTVAEYSPMWFRPDGALSAEDVADHNAIYALRLVGVLSAGDPDAELLAVHAYLADEVAEDAAPR